MENASKALLIAGGILIAILIISLLVVMTRQIGNYQRNQDITAKTKQLSEFNRDFERYMEDDIEGVDIVSIINKIQNYNKQQKDAMEKNEQTSNKSVDYSIPMTLYVTGLEAFNNKYAYTDSTNKLFDKDLEYRSDGTNSGGTKLMNQIRSFTEAENGVGISTLKKLSSIYDPEKTNQENIEAIQIAAGKEVIENGRRVNQKNSYTLNDSRFKNYDGVTPVKLDVIKKYRQYSEFKSEKFEPVGEPEYKNGQITKLTFRYKAQ